MKLVSIKSSGKNLDVAFIFDFIGIVDATSADCCEVVGIDENAEKIATITALIEADIANLKKINSIWFFSFQKYT